MNGTLISGEPLDVKASGIGRSWFEGAALDSRSVAERQLFFALPGERTDGHRFLPLAAEAGAAALVVEPERMVTARNELAEKERASFDRRLARQPRIEVRDSFGALHDLTRAVRETVPEHLVAITGSAGKTTTKELLRAMLATRFRVAATPGNFNSLYGFPMALLNIPEDTEWMVAEMAMSTPGELSRVSRLGRPEVAVLTNVRLAHLEAFDSASQRAGLRDIGESKSGILDGLAPDGWIVANAADPEVVRIARRHLERFPRARVEWFALEREQSLEPTLLRIDDLEPIGRSATSGSSFTLARATEGPGGGAVKVVLPLHGSVNVENFLAAATCAVSLGVSVAEIAVAVESLEPLAGRGDVNVLERGARVIDDSYNSNPDALRKALQAMLDLPGRRRWAVIGAMLELGRSSHELHREAAKTVAECGLAPLFVVGEQARPLFDAATELGVPARLFGDAADAAEAASAELRSNDLVLVKGSRGNGLEAVVRSLVAAGGGRRKGGC